jgi:hypothetical protein
MAHAYHPNFPAAYEPEHKVAVNGGPVIKTNANQRYATGADRGALHGPCRSTPACPASSTRIAATSAAAAPSAPSSPRAWASPASTSARRCGPCTARAKAPARSIPAYMVAALAACYLS